MQHIKIIDQSDVDTLEALAEILPKLEEKRGPLTALAHKLLSIVGRIEKNSDAGINGIADRGIVLEREMVVKFLHNLSVSSRGFNPSERWCFGYASDQIDAGAHRNSTP